MKSIKEKAEEYSFIKQGIDPSGIQYRDFNINKQEGFEAGANYVLNEIENIIKSDRILGHSFPSLEMRYNQIISVIEQLKK